MSIVHRPCHDQDLGSYHRHDKILYPSLGLGLGFVTVMIIALVVMR